MKKIFNLYNISLLLILVLISVLTLKTTEVKAAGTLIWPDGSTATISRTVENVYNAPVVDFTYSISDKAPTPSPSQTGTTADFDTGQNVNAKIKSLAAGSSKSYSQTDQNVVAIKKATQLPSGFTPTTGNTVSTSESDYPIYIFWDNASSTMYYYSEADVVYLNSDSSSMFFYFYNLTDISGLSRVDTSKVLYMSGLFNYCIALTNIDALLDWNTSNVTTMAGMFAYCSSLTNIDALSHWNVSSVTLMNGMFSNCTNLINIGGASNWDTSSVTTMAAMFGGCSSLENINGASNWDTSKVTNIGTMFSGCAKASGTFPILGNPTTYSVAFSGAATESGVQIIVNYGSGTTNIDDIIATKSSNSNVVKGIQVSPSSSDISISFNGTETVSNTYTASKSTTINLANMGLNLTEPGNYDLTVSESATSNNAYPTTNTEYTIVITVRNELNANNRPTGNLEARFYIKDANDNKVNTMSFSAPKDESKFGHIELTKKVGGLMGGINTYFDFSIQIDDAASNACSSYSGSEKYPVSGGDSSHVTISEVTKCKSGTKDSLSLKHNQTAVIGQFTYNNNTYDSISIDDYYKIVEASASNYTTTFKIGSGSSTSGRDTSSQSVSNGTNTVTYVNTREGSPLTGIVLTVLPFLILIGIGAGGLILFRKKKGFKKVKKEELEVI